MPPLDQLLSPLFGAILLGVLAGQLKLFSQEDARRFSRFVFQIAMPVAILDFTQGADPPGPAYFGVIGGYLIGLGVTTTAAIIVARQFGGLTTRQSGAAVFAAICGNAVFLGLPIALQVPAWGKGFLVLMFFEGFLAYLIGTALITWPEGDGASASTTQNLMKALGTSARNPIIIAMVTGFMISVSGIELPALLTEPLDLFGAIAAPFGLFILGLYLALLIPTWREVPPTLLVTLLPLKLVIFPIVSAGCTYLFTADLDLTLTAAFFTLLPPAVGSMVLAAHYQQLEQATAALVAIGSVIGLISTLIFLVMVP